jgi:hypothetical protein
VGNFDERNWGISVSAVSGEMPRPNCPAIPSGSYVQSLELWLDSPGLASVKIGHTAVTPAYENLYDAHFECLDGDCDLDLLKSGDSCFDYADCAGWLSDPNRDALYSCTYAGVTRPLSQCYIYGPMFEVTGPAYGDYTTGATLPIATTLSEIDLLARDLLDREWAVWGPTQAGFQTGYGDEARAARLVAQQCVAQGTEDECRLLPIFAPGDNVKEAAVHDKEAIMGLGSTSTPAPAQLTYADNALIRSWYSGYEPCSVGYGSGENCDEYPFYSTAEAGPPLASLRVIDRDDNIHEGTYLDGFYTVCLIPKNAGSDSAFLVVPIPSGGPMNSRSTITAFWCGLP